VKLKNQEKYFLVKKKNALEKFYGRFSNTFSVIMIMAATDNILTIFLNGREVKNMILIRIINFLPFGKLSYPFPHVHILFYHC
jgi:hypothetical protein